MALAALPNQRSSESVGVWMWREFVFSIANGDDIIFELEENVVVLDAIVCVTTAATGTAQDAVLQMANVAGDVVLIASIDLQAGTSVNRYDFATPHASLGTKTDGPKTPIQFAVTNTTPAAGAVCLMGLYVARLDYDS